MNSCHHGEQPSTCYRCELEQEVERLRAAVLRASVLFHSLGAPHLAEEMERALDGRGGEGEAGGWLPGCSHNPMKRDDVGGEG